MGFPPESARPLPVTDCALAALVPAVAVMNKTGMIYVFNRLTGEALFPIEERAVPQTDVPGEKT